MPDTALVRDIAHLQAAAIDSRYDEASRICRQIATRIRELATATATRVAQSAAANGVKVGSEWVPLSVFAHEIGVDARTVKKKVDGKPYVKRWGPRIIQIELTAARADWKAMGGAPR